MSEYQIVKLEEVDDWLGDYPGEMRGITYAIGAEQAALTYRRMPQHTGSKGSYGHRHKEQEELYLVLSGRLQFKLGDEIVELGEARGDSRPARHLARGLERRAGGRRARDRLEADRRSAGRHRDDRRLLAGVSSERLGVGPGVRIAGPRSRATGSGPVKRSRKPSVAAGGGPPRRLAAAAQQLDVRVGDDLGADRVGRPHHVPLPSLGLEYLDIEILTSNCLDVKTFAVKMCVRWPQPPKTTSTASCAASQCCRVRWRSTWTSRRSSTGSAASTGA